MNKHKKFIKDAYDGKYGSMCQDWKNTILEHYPEFIKFRLNTWYKSTVHRDKIFYPTKENIRGVLYGYGIDDGEWIEELVDNGRTCLCNETAKLYLYEASKKEVESALIKEAQRRGFTEGTYSKCLVSRRSSYVINDNCWDYRSNSDHLFNGICLVYHEGQWAEIINTMTKKEAEEKLGCKII